MPLHIPTAGIYRPGRLSDFATDESFVPGFAKADRDVGLAFGQIKVPVADHELEPQTRIACMKGVDEWCPSETIRHARSAGQANGASEAFVTRAEVTFEGCHRCLHTLDSGPQFFSELGQSITAEMALNQPATDTGAHLIAHHTGINFQYLMDDSALALAQGGQRDGCAAADRGQCDALGTVLHEGG